MFRSSPLFVATALALALLAPPLSSVAQDAEAPTQARVPLGRALSTFASQHGVALAFDPALTAGRQAPVLRGRPSLEDGLRQLLAGTSLRAVRRPDGSYLLQPGDAARSGNARMPTLRIGGGSTQAFPYAEGQVLDADYLQAQVKGNGDLATLLRINPAVQFSNNAQSARNGGEIRPADFSINGAPFYQNLLLLDGASFNNDLDPANTIVPGVIRANDVEDVPSNAQGIALDTDLIESLAVYDSNVPAAYGGFTGGVVDATSRKAGNALSGKVWFRMSRSAWNELIVHPGQEDSYAESATYAFQPEYDKYRIGARLEGRTRNGLGLIGTVSRTRSEIPLRAYTAGNVSSSDAYKRTQTRENTAATLAVDWDNGEGLSLGGNVTYAPTDDRYFIAGTRNSWFDIKSGGPVLSLRARVERNAWTFNNTLSYSDVETSRRSEEDYFRNWARSEAFDWGTNNSSIEGAWGNIDQHDRKLGYRFTADREVFSLGRSEHRLQFGAGVQRRDAYYERLNDHYNYQQPRATTSCTLSTGEIDSDSCSLSPVFVTTTNGVRAGQGQYFNRLQLYHAGSFKVSGTELEAWMQDDIRLGSLSVRPGLRVDRNSIWNQTTLAPRLAVSWDVGGTGSTVLSSGYNRYYGRNFFTYLMREGREHLHETRNRTSSATPWDTVTGTRFTTANRVADLDMPYTNEWTLGLRQSLAGLDINLKYVNRANRREVLLLLVDEAYDRTVYNSRLFEYTNAGRSESEIYTLSVAPSQPWQWGATRTHAQLAFDYTDIKRSYNDYQTELSTDDFFFEPIYYKGSVTTRLELPADNYSRPWSARLSTTTTLPWGLSWSNFLRYRAGYRAVAKTSQEILHEGQYVPVYADTRYPGGWTWDSTLEYALALPHAQEAYVRVEAQNVLNRSNRIVGTTASSIYYEPGRSYWLELGYRF
jgi:hypothetical protein